MLRILLPKRPLLAGVGHRLGLTLSPYSRPIQPQEQSGVVFQFRTSVGTSECSGVPAQIVHLAGLATARRLKSADPASRLDPLGPIVFQSPLPPVLPYTAACMDRGVTAVRASHKCMAIVSQA